MQKNKHTPLVSVALATYNGEKFLAEQLDSLAGQTYKNIEVIISDDGSADGTWAILENYAARYPHFFIYRNTGQPGIKRNFEHALSHCTGEYIALCDQDDLWMPDKLSLLINNINGYSLIYHDSLFTDETGSSLDKTFSADLRRYTGSDPRVFLLANCVPGHALLFHRELLDIALPFPDAKHHDWWLAFRAASHAGVQYLDKVLVHYRQHQNSQTDFLMLKKEKADIEKEESGDNNWFAACAAAEGKHRMFFQRWATLFKKRHSRQGKLKLFLLAVSHMNSLFYIHNKNKTRTLKYIYRKIIKERYYEI